MATVRKDKKGSWLVLWKPNCGSYRSSDQIKIKSIGRVFSLKACTGACTLSVDLRVVESETSTREHPFSISSVLGNEMEEMIKKERNWWHIEFRNQTPVNLVFNIKVHSIEEECLKDQLSKLLDIRTGPDIQVKVKDREFWAHSTLLAAASPVMAAMLDPDKFKEGHTKQIEINDVNPEVFYQLLIYMNTGIAPQFEEDSVEEIFLAADKYQLEALKNTFENFLVWHLKPETAIHFLVLANRHSAPFLLEAALQSLVEQREQVWELPEWNELYQQRGKLFFIASRRVALDRYQLD